MIEGAKADAGKLRWDLLPPRGLEEIIKVLGYGAAKYAPENWRQVPEARRRYFAAALRHIWTWWVGPSTDEESGLHHLAHAACCLLFLMDLEWELRRQAQKEAK